MHVYDGYYLVCTVLVSAHLRENGVFFYPLLELRGGFSDLTPDLAIKRGASSCCNELTQN